MCIIERIYHFMLQQVGTSLKIHIEFVIPDIEWRYRPFHKTLPRSSAFVNWISLRFYETDCTKHKILSVCIKTPYSKNWKGLCFQLKYIFKTTRISLPTSQSFFFMNGCTFFLFFWNPRIKYNFHCLIHNILLLLLFCIVRKKL